MNFDTIGLILILINLLCIIHQARIIHELEEELEKYENDEGENYGK